MVQRARLRPASRQGDRRCAATSARRTAGTSSAASSKRTNERARTSRRITSAFDLEVRPFFEDDTAVISEALAKAGELTQGLCSPWQNDYRECSCYYWASARPDFVNVETDANGLSDGDNWFQRKRTGSYVPDDYADSRLVMYDELFREWEKRPEVPDRRTGRGDAPGPGASRRQER